MRQSSRNADTDISASGGDAALEPVVADKVRVLAVPLLKQSVGDPDALIRRMGATAYARCTFGDDTDDAMPVLIKALKDEVRVVSDSAIIGLGVLGTRSSVDSLCQLLSGGTEARALLGKNKEVPATVRATAAFALGIAGTRSSALISGSPAAALLRGVLDPKTPIDIQIASLAALGAAKDGSVLSACISVLKDRSRPALVRAWAANTLGRLRFPQARESLVEGIGDSVADVSRASAYALGFVAKAEDEAAASALLKAAQAHSDRGTRNLSFLALGELGAPEGLKLLLHSLRKGKVADRTHAACALGIHTRKRGDPGHSIGEQLFKAYKRAKSSSERSAYAIALGLSRYTPAAKLLVKDLRARRAPELRRALAAAVALLPNQNAIPILRKLAARPKNASVAQWVGMALGTLGDAKAVEYLAKSLRTKSNNNSYRAAGALGLGYLGDASAMATLITTVENPRRDMNKATRAAAVGALGLLGNKDVIPLICLMRSHINWFSLTPHMHEMLFRL